MPFAKFAKVFSHQMNLLYGMYAADALSNNEEKYYFHLTPYGCVTH